MSDATTIVNEALDQLRERERLNEGQLAQRLNIDPVTLWRWRQGGFGKAVAILIPLVANTPPHPQPADDSLLIAA